MKFLSAAIAIIFLLSTFVSSSAFADAKRVKAVQKERSLFARIFKPNKSKKSTKKIRRNKNGTRIIYGDEKKKKRYKATPVALKKVSSPKRPSRDVLRYVKASSAQRIEARVDLSEQRMSVYKGGKKLYSWPVSTGRSGHNTPTGSYKPYRMHNIWYSSKYEWAPMPHAIFFKGGYAVHATNSIKRLGRRASHGCVRLHPKNAAALFALVRQNGANNTSIKIVQ